MGSVAGLVFWPTWVSGNCHSWVPIDTAAVCFYVGDSCSIGDGEGIARGEPQRHEGYPEAWGRDWRLLDYSDTVNWVLWGKVGGMFAMLALELLQPWS